ncbi:MAG: type I restriction enzyme HsdR N-terminal domain-containing protein [Tannerella sp.]|nr:type I restriction enzyme HsdR N-terminal domain-containing protein [Tannerella sp.]
MQTLNLPPFDAKYSNKNGKPCIYDRLRRKNVALTPEERVRQYFVNFLITCKSFPPERMANEVSISVNTTAKRCDTVVYDNYLTPLAIIEYKAPDVTISADVFDQIARYNFVLRVPYLIVSNGIDHFCCKIDYSSMKCGFIDHIPGYDEMKSEQTGS